MGRDFFLQNIQMIQQIPELKALLDAAATQRRKDQFMAACRDAGHVLKIAIPIVAICILSVYISIEQVRYLEEDTRNRYYNANHRPGPLTQEDAAARDQLLSFLLTNPFHRNVIMHEEQTWLPASLSNFKKYIFLTTIIWLYAFHTRVVRPFFTAAGLWPITRVASNTITYVDIISAVENHTKNPIVIEDRFCCTYITQVIMTNPCCVEIKGNTGNWQKFPLCYEKAALETWLQGHPGHFPDPQLAGRVIVKSDYRIVDQLTLAAEIDAFMQKELKKIAPETKMANAGRL